MEESQIKQVSVLSRLMVSRLMDERIQEQMPRKSSMLLKTSVFAWMGIDGEISSNKKGY